MWKAILEAIVTAIRKRLTWKAILNVSFWTLLFGIFGDAATSQGGGGASSVEIKYDGGSCECGSEPKLCGEGLKCRWKPKEASRTYR